jgi:hypothetical protein
MQRADGTRILGGFTIEYDLTDEKEHSSDSNKALQRLFIGSIAQLVDLWRHVPGRPLISDELGCLFQAEVQALFLDIVSLVLSFLYFGTNCTPRCIL